MLVENFLPDALVQYGLTPAHLATLNPRLVSCSISGFGRTGPQADVAGYDLVTQAGTGLMSITGEPDGPPLKVGVAISDVLTGLYAAISVLAGLYARGRGEPGLAFDLALADCTLASLVNVVQSVLVTGDRPRRWGNAHPQIVPYESFETADGYLVIGVGTDDQWRKFCAATEHTDWASDVRFQTNAERVKHRDELLALVRPAGTAKDAASLAGVALRNRHTTRARALRRRSVSITAGCGARDDLAHRRQPGAELFAARQCDPLRRGARPAGRGTSRTRPTLGRSVARLARPG